jgi:hypothetical protein
MWLGQHACAEVAGSVVMMVNFMLVCASTTPLLLMLHAMMQPSSPVDKPVNSRLKDCVRHVCGTSSLCNLTCSQSGPKQGTPRGIHSCHPHKQGPPMWASESGRQCKPAPQHCWRRWWSCHRLRAHTCLSDTLTTDRHTEH